MVQFEVLMTITDHLAKIREHRRRKLLDIRKLIKFESNTSKASENIAAKIAKLYRHFYDGRGGSLCSPSSEILCDFAELYQFFVLFQ